MSDSAFKASRWSKLQRACQVSSETQQPASYALLDQGMPASMQAASVDFVLHKATDFMTVEHQASRCTPRWSKQVLELQQACSAAGKPFLEDLTAVAQVVDRWQLHQIISLAAAAAQAEGHSLHAPPSCLVAQHSSDAEAQAQQAGVSHPCIAKPQAACGVPEAHIMSIIFADQGFEALARHQGPMVVQQFISHAGFLHKVYVIGHRVFALRKASLSLPDPSTSAETPASSVTFDALHAVPDCLQPQQPDADTSSSAEQPPEGLILAAAGALQRQLGLQLFGFDLVMQPGTGKAYVVDVNYFTVPYQEPRIGSWLAEALQDMAAAYQTGESSAGRKQMQFMG